MIPARADVGVVGNGQRGYHFFGQAGTRPKSVRFGEVVPVRIGNGIFS